MKKPITVTNRQEAVENAVLKRRLSGNVFGHARNEIPLKEPQKWYTRWENTLTNPQMHFEMVHELGYVTVTEADLSVPAAEAGVQLTPDGNVCRGSGAMIEILYKMAREDRAALEAAQTEHNNRIIGKGSQSGTRNAIANAASAALGDEAATFLNSMPGSVVDSLTNEGQQ
jgi:hypothetical protein